MAKAKKVVKKVAAKKKAAPQKASGKAKIKAKPKAKPKAPKKVAVKAKGKVASKPAVKAKAKAQAKPAKAKVTADAKVAPKAKDLLKAKKPPVTEVVIEEVEIVESEPPEAPEEVVLTDAEGRRYCRVKDCDQLATVDGYCRYHYLLFWKKIQVRKKILTEGKLERYIEELTARYPDKFLDMLRKDLRSEKEFLAAIQELEIDESQGDNEFEDEGENLIDEVRGMSEPSSAREEEDF